MQAQQIVAADTRNWRPKEWCRDAGINIAKLYTLSAEQQPRRGEPQGSKASPFRSRT
jgi:hypothetical protein